MLLKNASIAGITIVATASEAADREGLQPNVSPMSLVPIPQKYSAGAPRIKLIFDVLQTYEGVLIVARAEDGDKKKNVFEVNTAGVKCPPSRERVHRSSLFIPGGGGIRGLSGVSCTYFCRCTYPQKSTQLIPGIALAAV